MSLDQIKDSQRLIGVLGQNAEYYFWEITLSENQTWQSDVINVKGKSIIAVAIRNENSPASLPYAGVKACLADGSKAGWLGGGMNAGVAVGGVLTAWVPSPTQYIRVVVQTGSTTGTYTARIWLAIYPM